MPYNDNLPKVQELINNLLIVLSEKEKFIIENRFSLNDNPRLTLETIGKKLKVPDNKLIIDIETTGNTVSSTIPIALKNSIDQGKIKRGSILLIAGFGVGFSWGGTILKF